MEASERVTFDQFCKNVASAVMLYVDKVAKMAMLVIAFDRTLKGIFNGNVTVRICQLTHSILRFFDDIEFGFNRLGSELAGMFLGIV